MACFPSLLYTFFNWYGAIEGHFYDGQIQLISSALSMLCMLIPRSSICLQLFYLSRVHPLNIFSILIFGKLIMWWTQNGSKFWCHSIQCGGIEIHSISLTWVRALFFGVGTEFHMNSKPHRKGFKIFQTQMKTQKPSKNRGDRHQPCEHVFVIQISILCCLCLFFWNWYICSCCKR